MGRDARARAIQLPAWNEALGLPRPWDQQWSLRIQQVLAYETDLLEYPDIFEGSVVMEGLVGELLEGAREEMARVAEQGGAVEAVPYMKAALVESHRERIARIESRRAGAGGRQPLRGDRAVAADRGRRGRDPGRRPGRRGRASRRRSTPGARRATRAAVDAALAELARVAQPRTRTSCPRRSPPPARARRRASGRATLRDAFGSYRAPTGVGEAAAPGAGRGDRGAARRRRRAVGGARADAEDPRRQAGARRALQRRRADRRAGARRRHGGRLRGDPADAVADRALGGRRGRPRDRALDPLGLAPRADPGP